MELQEFLDYVRTGKAPHTPDIYEFMGRMSNEARFRKNITVGKNVVIGDVPAKSSRK